MKRVLIIGGNGMAGHIVKVYLEQSKCDVYYTTRDKQDSNDKHFCFDATNVADIVNILNKISPDYVVNCIGILNAAAEENKSMAVCVNSLFPHFLDEQSQKFDYKLIHISTDCVFSGEKGGYIESDFPDAQSFYGRTKALGEVNNQASVTIRTSIIGPETRETRIGLLDWFLKQSGDIKGYTKSFWTGVTTLQLAKFILDITKNDISGLVHLVNKEKISKYHLLLLFKKYFEKDINISPSGDYVSDKSLINTRDDCSILVPDYETMVRELRDWIKESQLYKDLQ